MIESSSRSDNSWHCCWNSMSLKRCSGSLSFLCRRSTCRCSFSASRSACFFSQSAILDRRHTFGIPGDSVSDFKLFRPGILLLLMVDVSQTSAAQISTGFTVCCLLNLSAQSPQHRAKPWKNRSLWCYRRKHVSCWTVHQDHTSFTTTEPWLQVIDRSTLQRLVQIRESTISDHVEIIWRATTLQGHEVKTVEIIQKITKTNIPRPIINIYF